MQKHILKADKRIITGKKVKNLRKDGFLPGNIYGKNVTSEAVQTNLKEFLKVYHDVGETGLIDLQIDSSSRPVLIHNLQYNPVSDLPLHADFYQVNLKEKITTHVPLEFIGQPEAVTQKIGALLTILDEIEVEALPADLPEKIELDVTKLKEIDQEIKVKDIVVAASYAAYKDKVEILTDSELTVVKIGPLVSEDTAKEAAAEEAAKAAAAVTAAGAAPAEGAAPTSVPAGGAGTPAKSEAVKSESKKPEPKKEEKKK